MVGSTYYYTSTGGRYNPSTDSWMATSTNNAPDPRYFHTAVWTGNEMIIWGGYYYDNHSPVYYFNTGGRYNPGTDSWAPTSTNNAPFAREGPTAIWTGNEMIVWGGNGGGSYTNTGSCYDPSTDSWIENSTYNAPAGKVGPPVVWTGTEMIVWGGNPISSTGGRYVP